MNNHLPYGIQCGKGWAGLYQPLLDLCKLKGIKVQQVKEKFGGLRFYIQGDPENYMWDIIRAAEYESFHVCEDCGASGIDRYDHEAQKPIYVAKTKGNGWIRTLCDSCRVLWDNRK
jgi:hypothetical protein